MTGVRPGHPEYWRLRRGTGYPCSLYLVMPSSKASYLSKWQRPTGHSSMQSSLQEHEATGISAKDWCDSRGLNYNSARRYLKSRGQSLRNLTNLA